jgi:hypothetical protein
LWSDNNFYLVHVLWLLFFVISDIKV